MEHASLSTSQLIVSPTLRRSLHWLGGGIAIIGIVFVAFRFHEYRAGLDFSLFTTSTWFLLLGLALLYGMSNLLLALAWWKLLAQFGVKVTRLWSIRIYGISQLARYLPGNIFHLAGRQAMGMAAGVPGWPLAKSAVWELGLISITGALFGLLAFPLMSTTLTAAASVGMFAMMMGIVSILLWRFFGQSVAHAFGWYVGFLLISGLLFVVLIELLVENNGAGIDFWLSLGGAYVLAWLAGLVTPGAPAGVGVRELILFFLLKGMIAEADLLLAVVLGRIITVGGDSLYYFVSLLMKDNGIRKSPY